MPEIIKQGTWPLTAKKVVTVCKRCGTEFSFMAHEEGTLVDDSWVKPFVRIACPLCELECQAVI